MRIDVSGKHLDVTPALHEYASTKCGRLPKYYDGVQQVHVVLDQTRHEQFEVEVRVDVEHHDAFVARTDGDDLYRCIDLTVDKMVRQLSDFKDRLKNGKR
jgi:putative sigma-54 modulation protein